MFLIMLKACTDPSQSVFSILFNKFSYCEIQTETWFYFDGICSKMYQIAWHNVIDA